MITLQYNSLVQLVDEIIGQFSKMNDNNPLDRDSAVQWGIDCLREIGTATNEQKEPLVLTVINGQAKLPEDVTIINGVYLNSPQFNVQGYQKTYSLQYVAGLRSNNVCVDTDNNTNIKITSPYTFSISYPYLTFNFSDQEVWLDYKGFKTDEFGIPMYPDIPSVKEAIISYVLYKWLYEDYLMDNIKSEKYQYLIGDKSLKMANARQDLLTPGMLEARNSIYQSRYRYNKFRIPK